MKAASSKAAYAASGYDHRVKLGDYRDKQRIEVSSGPRMICYSSIAAVRLSGTSVRTFEDTFTT